ncbi:MAG: isoprenylcysteine carboxylmethyltransferase family protein [Ignavibacteriales bacterium]|nr:isoprenylcysteine carboxylmethyltransferase family protein [Ignavibacteriales bacterium]
MKNISEIFFKYRSYTPVPFVILMLIFQEATLGSLIFGFVIAAAGEFFRFWGVSYAGSETRTTGTVGGTYLVVSGAFAHVRNPLYFGNMLIYAGIGTMALAWHPYLLLAAMIFFYFQYYSIISEEEKFLTQKFDSQYTEYVKKVPRWIPTFAKYKNPGIPQPDFNPTAALKSESRTLQAISLITVILIIFYLVK